MRKLSRKPSKELKDCDNLYESVAKIRSEALAKIAKVEDKKAASESSDKKSVGGESGKAAEEGDDVEMNEEASPESKGPVVVLD